MSQKDSTELLSNIPSLKRLLDKTKYLSAISQQVLACLPKELQPHCQIANFRDGILIIYVTTASWSTKLRYLTPALLKQLRNEKNLQQLASIRIKVQPTYQTTKKSLPIASPLSEKNRRLFDSLKKILAGKKEKN